MGKRMEIRMDKDGGRKEWWGNGNEDVMGE